jgi:hypothetical protein
MMRVNVVDPARGSKGHEVEGGSERGAAIVVG